MTDVETLTGSTSSDTVTLSALQLAGFGTINLVSGTDTLNVVASGDISPLAHATMSNVETGNLTGTTGTDTMTLTGAQLDAILIGSGTINLGSGTGDTINLTSTSSDLNTLGATNASIQGVEAISAATAAAGVTITLSGQTEAFAITGSAQADTITGGEGADTIAAGGGNDTINLANGQFVAGESIEGGANSAHAIVLTNGAPRSTSRRHGDGHRDADRQQRQRHRDDDGVAAGRLQHHQSRRRHGRAERRGQRRHLGACACRRSAMSKPATSPAPRAPTR